MLCWYFKYSKVKANRFLQRWDHVDARKDSKQSENSQQLNKLFSIYKIWFFKALLLIIYTYLIKLFYHNISTYAIDLASCT
jgi:hypothetical protein